MNITRVEIEELFGELNHVVPFKEGGITFIHGPNGCGKTTFLNLICAFFERDFSALISVPFKRMVIEFSNGDVFNIVRDRVRLSEPTLLDTPDDDVADGFDLKIVLTNKGAKLGEFSYRSHLKEIAKKQLAINPALIERRVPQLRRLAPNVWHDTISRRRYTTAEVVERFGEVIGIPVRFRAPLWLNEKLSNCRVGFVKAQRLVATPGVSKNFRSESADSSVESIVSWSDRIKELIAKQLADSAVKAQALDRTFPARLMEIKKSNLPSNEKIIRELYKNTEETSQSLMSAGLLEKAESVSLPDGRLSPTERRVLSLYLHDLKSKLASYEGLQRRIEALLEIVGGKLKRKFLSIDRTSGLSVHPAQGATDELKLSMLSSGEKNQIILFCELIFSDLDNNIYFIDEPEISLHVEWQRQFLRDLEKVRHLTGATFLVATHSPQIINNRRDLAVALDGGVEE